MLLFLLWLRLDNNLLQRFVVFGFDSARRAVNRRESQWIVVSGVTFAHNWQQLIDLRTVGAISGLLSVVPMFALCLVTSQNLLRGSGGQPLLPLLPPVVAKFTAVPRSVAAIKKNKKRSETAKEIQRNVNIVTLISRPACYLCHSRARALSLSLPLSHCLSLW